ncbi:MAG: translation initiation factor IF-2 [Leptospirales bacterium]|nr:translation initiation factor IF-2 [Leptospirales bacterium]
MERRIESVKKRKLEDAEKAKKNKKIKLKKKVDVSNDIRKKKGLELREERDDNDDVASDNVKFNDKAATSDNVNDSTKSESNKKSEYKPRQKPDGKSENKSDGKTRYQGRPRQTGQGSTDGKPRYQDRQRQSGQGSTDNKPRQDKQRQTGQGSASGKPRYQDRQRQSGQGSSNARTRYQGQKNEGRSSGDRDESQRPGFIRRPGNDDVSSSIEIDDQAVKKNKGLDKEKEKEKHKEKEFRRLNKKEKEEAEKALILKKKQNLEIRRIVSPEKINITESITVGELAKKLNVKASEVIGKLMKLGEMATINQAIDSDTAAILASEYNTEVGVVSLFDETVIKIEQEDRAEDAVPRPPVVTVMGHVDHGKTKLLDAIRSANVIDSEFGGITQHIGAYTVAVGDKSITFFDTPGHAAFTTMRARGASITDIVILVVAANDGVMPQTVEAISHAKAANVPIIVAINKMDLPEANSTKVKQELSNYGLMPEDWGGTTLFAEISAKQNSNIDQLLELVLIQAEMLELKANPKLLAKGTVIESRLDPGRGAVSTVLVQSGTLNLSDPFVVGVYSGRARAMFDDKRNSIENAGPSMPVEILGLSGVPAAGDPFEGVESDRMAKQISQKRLEYKRIESAKKVRKVTLESLNEMIKEGEVKDLNVIVKADVDGSSQALTEALEKLSNEEIRVRVIHSGAGGINDSDVMLASASNAIIIGYHVRPTGKVADLAEKEDVSIRFYNIIFEATDDIKAAMEGMLSPVLEEKVIGTGEIKQVFKVSKIGSIAGSICMSGKVIRKSKVRIIRDGVVVFDGSLASLKRYKDDVTTVEAGQEFGFSTENFNDIKEGDAFEAYEVIQTAKKL